MLPHMLVTEEDLQDPDYGSANIQMRKNAEALFTTQTFPNTMETRISNLLKRVSQIT